MKKWRNHGDRTGWEGAEDSRGKCPEAGTCNLPKLEAILEQLNPFNTGMGRTRAYPSLKEKPL